jgi:ferredoxin
MAALPDMRVVVDQTLCGTTGQCVLTLPGIFRQRDLDGVAEVCVATVPQALREQVQRAASQCPVAAIHIVEDATDRGLAGGPPGSPVPGAGRRAAPGTGSGERDEAT